MKDYNGLEKAILSQIESETDRIIKEEAANAAKRVETRVSEMAGQIASRVVSWVDFSQLQDRLVMTVRFPDRDGLLPGDR